MPDSDPVQSGPSAAADLEWVASLREASAKLRYDLAAGLVAGRRVLDAGCGTGFGLAVLANAGLETLVGVDRAQAKLDAVPPMAAGGASLIRAELSTLPFDDDCFDVIVCLGPLEDTSHCGDVVSELRRCLAPRGILVASVAAGSLAELQRSFASTRVVAETILLVGHTDGSAVASGALSGEHPPTQALVLATDGELPELESVTVPVGVADPGIAARAAAAIRAEREVLAAALRSAERSLAQRSETARALADCEARVSSVPDLEVHLLEAERRAELAEAELNNALERVEDVRAKLERAEATITAVTTSASWRATGPIRRVAALARRDPNG